MRILMTLVIAGLLAGCSSGSDSGGTAGGTGAVLTDEEKQVINEYVEQEQAKDHQDT